MSVFIDFDGYGTLTDLDSHADWANPPSPQGILTVASGLVWSNSGGFVALCRYIGHSFNSNHSSEVTFDVVTPGASGTAQGCAVRLQSGAISGYYAFVEPSNPGNWYLGVVNAGTHTYPFSGTANSENDGCKLRLSVTGAGSATRLTLEHNNGIGGGWTTLLSNGDPGIYFDGGSPGVVGYSNEVKLKINDVTFTGETGGVDPTYTVTGRPFLYTAANWPSATFALEAEVRATTGTAYISLKDETAGTIVTAATLSTTSATFARVRGGNFTMTDGHTYRAVHGKAGSDAGEVKSITIIAK